MRETLNGGFFRKLKRRVYDERPSVERKQTQAEVQKKRRTAAARTCLTPTRREEARHPNQGLYPKSPERGAVPPARAA